jgi:hypothetical protein
MSRATLTIDRSAASRRAMVADDRRRSSMWALNASAMRLA